MKVEYLSFVLAPGGVYSVPGDTGFTALGSDPLHPAPASPQLFQLVSFNAFRMDHVRTSSLMQMKSWRKPAFIQRLDIVDTEEDATDEHLDVFPLGVPEPVDILFEFTWQEWTEKLLTWSIGASSVAGCLRISSPLPAASHWTYGWDNASIFERVRMRVLYHASLPTLHLQISPQELGVSA